MSRSTAAHSMTPHVRNRREPVRRPQPLPDASRLAHPHVHCGVTLHGPGESLLGLGEGAVEQSLASGITDNLRGTTLTKDHDTDTHPRGRRLNPGEPPNVPADRARIAVGEGRCGQKEEFDGRHGRDPPEASVRRQQTDTGRVARPRLSRGRGHVATLLWKMGIEALVCATDYAPGRIRTFDLGIKSPLLYQLSHGRAPGLYTIRR